MADVVIIGAGPAGLALAYELALADVDAVVLEQREERLEQIKGGTMQPRTIELFDLRGLVEPLSEHAFERERVGGHFGGLPVPLDCSGWNTRHPTPVGLPQWTIEKVLEEHATALGARVLRGRAVTAVEQDESSVTVHAGGETFEARYVVACDGARSTVRKFLGLPFPGRDGTFTGTLTDITLTSTSDLVPKRAGHFSDLMRSANGYWAMLVPVGGDLYRLTAGVTGEQAERDSPVTEAEVAKALTAVYGEETRLGRILHASRFSDATRQLERYRHGRILFAGDAAHIHPPYGGQGLNLGVQDAMNLGWKLASTVHGHTGESLLDTYHDERHPPAASVLRHTAAQRVLADPKPGEDVTALRDVLTDLLRVPEANHRMAGLMSGLALRYDLGGGHPLVGHRIPDADLVTANGRTRVAELFRAGRAVLLDLSGDSGAEPLAHPTVDVLPAKCAEDLGATRVLIRPDGYVCWAGDGDPAAAAERWFGHPDRFCRGRNV
ncbi:FAD-dependent monooxygenase [Amycolatopsis minnesotensis]|uniref:FAD-dependent monooxygenase n=1 Tax=Amycolatopsis minnesotensis TaxID=337894 RepID=A0ABN2Q3W5_9PSEU